LSSTYGIEAPSGEASPRNGKRTIGNKPVTGTGKISNDQKMDINRTTYVHRAGYDIRLLTLEFLIIIFELTITYEVSMSE